MKRLFFIIFVILTFMSACDEKPKNPVAEVGDNLINSYKKGMRAGAIANLHALKMAIQVYYAENDKYPENLDELSNLVKSSSEIDFSGFDYDPESGSISINNSPGG